MCGIFGYIGSKPASPILIAGLKCLEYRGYDSAGICLVENQELFSCKSPGKITELESKILNEKPSQATLGIGHTRWATHGEPTEKNAHPHFDCKKEIAVVHNGIIENYQALKSLLEKEGHIFASQTDTEVIAHLIEKFYPHTITRTNSSEFAAESNELSFSVGVNSYENSFEKAVLKTVEVLEGTFGLAVVCKKEQKIVAVKKGSPLVLGIGDKEIFVASDAAALINHTKRVIYLEDNEMAVLSIDGFAVKKFDGTIIEKEIQELKWSVGQIEKGGFEHFMLKEIFEQPQAIANTLRGRLSNNGVKLSFAFDLSFI